MATYWISFRIHDDSGYSATYQDLIDAVKNALSSSKWWYDTTSFYIIESDDSISQLANRMKDVIREDRDLVVIGMPEFKSGRVVGHCPDGDIFSLIPFMKKV